VGWAIGVVVALIVAAALALVITQANQDEDPGPPPGSALPGTTAAPGLPPVTSTPPITPTTQPGPPTPTQGAQSAGLYATTTFQPVLQYRLDDGRWSVAEGDRNADWIELTRDDNRHVLNFIRVQRVYRSTGSILTPDDALRAVEQAPDDLVGWLTRHPQRRDTSRSQSFSRLPKGADTGTQIDFTVAPGYNYQNCPGPCALLFQLDGNRPASKQGGERTRFYVFRVGGDTVVASVSAPDADFDAFVRLAEGVIASAELTRR
jgi:hypothetical protein